MVANTRTADRNPRNRPDDRPQPARPRVPEPDEVTEADAQEIEADGHYVTALLCGEEVRVIPPGAWRQSWQRQLNQGQIDAFVEAVFHPDDIDLYYELDPTNTEFGEFVGDAAQQAGESLGKSRGPAPSSRRTRKR